MNANDLQVLAGGTSAAAGRGIFGDTPTGFTADEKQILRKHVVDLRLGAFSDGGIFETSLADVERIFGELLPEELEKRKAEGQPLRLASTQFQAQARLPTVPPQAPSASPPDKPRFFPIP